MYRQFYDIQNIHWWFVTKRKIVLETVARFFRSGHGTNVLDIGCGSGLMLNALETIGTTHGMDMSDEAIAFSREIFRGAVEKGSLPDGIPFAGKTFDLIVALDVIEHVERDAESLRALHSRLAEGGIAVLTVPAYMFLWSAFDERNEHKRRYTLRELRTKLLRAGFSIDKISYYNTLLFPAIFAVRMLNNILKRDGSSDVQMPGRALNRVLALLFNLERPLLRHCNLPFGVSILAVVRK